MIDVIIFFLLVLLVVLVYSGFLSVIKFANRYFPRR